MRILSSLLALSLLAPSLSAASPDERLVCSKAQAARRWAEAGLAAPADLSEDPYTFGSDLLSDRLEIAVDFTNRRISGVNLMRFQVVESSGLTAFRFRLRRSLAIVTLRLDGADVTATRIDDFTVETAFPTALAAGTEHELRVEYAGTPTADGLGGFLFDSQGTSVYAWTLSQPWSAAAWWPVKDDSRDKRLVEVWLTTPTGFAAFSNGLLDGTDDLGNGQTRWRFRSDYPIAPYLVFLATGPYRTFSDTFQFQGWAMPLEFALYRESDNSGTREECREVGDMVRVFSEIFGVYPFIEEKYGIYEFGFGGGMEHQTMSGQGGCGSNLSAHELGHQWWGDNVTCSTWHDIWLNEGFATYCEALWQEFRPGGGTEELLHAMEQRRPISPNGTVWVADTSDIGRIFDGNTSYLKGGWVLHMLRHVVGDARFFAILQRWRETYGGASATTDDFEATAEAVYGQPLDWFFDRWVYGPGVPNYVWSYRNVEAAGRHWLEVRVAQNQNSSWGVFTMPIDLEVRTGAESARRRIWNDVRDEWVLLEVPSEVSSLAFDPDDRILWRSVAQTSHVAGPARIVETSPWPGSRVGHVGDIRIAFLDEVRTEADDFELIGPSGPVAVSFRWDAASLAVVLTPASALAPGDWMLKVSDQITSVLSGKQLDGDIAPAFSNAPLPSGNGAAGGPAEIRFIVGPEREERGQGAEDGKR